jgi:hypothetical protein
MSNRDHDDDEPFNDDPFVDPKTNLLSLIKLQYEKGMREEYAKVMRIVRDSPFSEKVKDDLSAILRSNGVEVYKEDNAQWKYTYDSLKVRTSIFY